MLGVDAGKPDANTLVVHAVLDPGAQHQIVVVQKTTGSVREQIQVSGAFVTIATPDGHTLTAVERHDSAAVTGGVPFPAVTTVYDVDVGAAGLISGGTYLLKVMAPDGRTVTGKRPSQMRFRRQPLFRHKVSIVRATPFHSIGPACLVRGIIKSSLARAQGHSACLPPTRPVALPGTAQALNAVDWCGDVREGHVPPTIVCQAFVRGLTHQLVVAAVDQNYFDYYRRESDIFTGAGFGNASRWWNWGVWVGCYACEADYRREVVYSGVHISSEQSLSRRCFLNYHQLVARQQLP